MAKIHVNQIAGALGGLFNGLVDMSDWANHPDQNVVNNAFLSRCLAAYAIQNQTELGTEVAAQAIVDGPKDSGIDAVYFDSSSKTLFVVQAKWRSEGTGSVDQAEALKFINGVKKLLDADYAELNDRLKAKEQEIGRALQDASASFALVLAHTGQDKVQEEAMKVITDYVESQNDPTELMRVVILDQARIHSSIAKGAAGAPIDVEVQLGDWGRITEPHYAIYGQACGSDIAEWMEKHGAALFAPNLRQFLGKTSANVEIISTVDNNPENFWYFNNGITVIANAIGKKPIGGNDRSSGVFECKGISVVNGAQTVGSLWQASKANGGAAAKTKVLVRIISLENCPENFGALVTRYTNTQNAVERRDFVALDPEQERLSRELLIEKVHYQYKSAEQKPPQAAGFDLEDATVALACANSDLGMAVQAKRELGRLWEDIDKAPYRALFNPSVNGPHLWATVQLSRAVQERLGSLQKGLTGKSQLISIHGNRFVVWLVMRRLKWSTKAVLSEVLKQVDAATQQALDDVVGFVSAKFSESYPASLFKNLSKCKKIAEALGAAD